MTLIVVAVESFITATFTRGNDYLPRVGSVDAKILSQQWVAFLSFFFFFSFSSFLFSAPHWCFRLCFLPAREHSTHLGERFVQHMKDLSFFNEQWCAIWPLSPAQLNVS